MKIEIIDLLKLVYEKKAPKKVKHGCHEYEFCKENNDYINENDDNLFEFLFKYEDNALFEEVEIVEDKPSKIDELTLNGINISYGLMSGWLGEVPSNNELKICSAIESTGIVTNKLVKTVNYLLERDGKL